MLDRFHSQLHLTFFQRQYNNYYETNDSEFIAQSPCEFKFFLNYRRNFISPKISPPPPKKTIFHGINCPQPTPQKNRELKYAGCGKH